MKGKSSKVRSSKTMAGSDPQKHFLSLIREFASEKSQGERRLVGLRRRIEELQSELEAVNADLESVKRTKETTEQELKGCEIELSLNDASVQTLEARISVVQGEIASVGSDLEAIKNKERASRDQFINQMFELNRKIRKFQDQFSCSISIESVGNATGLGIYPEESYEPMDGEDNRVTSRPLEETLANLISQTTKEEEEYQAEQNIRIQVHQELIDLEKRMSLMEMMVKGTKELQDLTRLTSELEQSFAFLSEELQKSCVCPKCHLDNMEALDNILQVNEAN